MLITTTIPFLPSNKPTGSQGTPTKYKRKHTRLMIWLEQSEDMSDYFWDMLLFNFLNFYGQFSTSSKEIKYK